MTILEELKLLWCQLSTDIMPQWRLVRGRRLATKCSHAPAFGVERVTLPFDDTVSTGWRARLNTLSNAS